MSMRNRREFLAAGARLGFGALVAGALPGVTFAAAPGARPFVVVILRGALDGLSAAPPYADPDYASARGPIAIARPGDTHGALDLDGFFGLHPAMPLLKERYRAGELLVVHATASAYRDRSHFDGQNVLENGGDRPSGTASGWLNRALGTLAGRGIDGLALGQNVPLILRGPVPVTSWAPSRLPEVEPDLVTRLRDLYSHDAILSARLDEATQIEALADDEKPTSSAMSDGNASMVDGNAAMVDGNVAMPASALGGGAAAQPRAGGYQRLKLIAQTAGRMLAAPTGPRVAVFDATGWDTHAGEGAGDGQLAARLGGLDEVLDALRSGLGSEWSRTAVLVCTEFGRTVQVNGTRGTDHGTGAAAFVLGGAIRGGRVLADWPGLGERQRYEGRDLRATTDLRAVAKGLLRDHLGIGESALSEVFPGSERVPATRDLVRA
jgi:uncharacterized protein (DUF1501 family)